MARNSYSVAKIDWCTSNEQVHTLMNHVCQNDTRKRPWLMGIYWLTVPSLRVFDSRWSLFQTLTWFFQYNIFTLDMEPRYDQVILMQSSSDFFLFWWCMGASSGCSILYVDEAMIVEFAELPSVDNILDLSSNDNLKKPPKKSQAHHSWAHLTIDDSIRMVTETPPKLACGTIQT